MNEEKNTSPDSHVETSSKASYKFMAAKKDPPVENTSLEETFPSIKSMEQKVITAPSKESIHKRRSASSLNYAETFLVRYELSSRQGLHLEKETIATIKRIINSIGGERLTVSGFVENVLRHHFECYKDEVNRLHEEALRSPIQ